MLFEGSGAAGEVASGPTAVGRSADASRVAELSNITCARCRLAPRALTASMRRQLSAERPPHLEPAWLPLDIRRTATQVRWLAQAGKAAGAGALRATNFWPAM